MKCALIMAGGQGIRLYPISTKEKPKQFLPLINDEALLKNTYNRINKFINKENIFIVLPKEYKHFVNEILPFVKEQNVIVEPDMKGTASGILFSSFYISMIRKDAILYVFPSDHYIENNESFIETMNNGYNYLLNNDHIVLFGIEPTYPSDHYGYIECLSKKDISKVSSFKEKPNHELAHNYIQSNKYLWNSGIFLFKINYILKEFRSYQSNNYKIIESIFNNLEELELELFDYVN